MVSDILDFSLIILNKLRLDVKARDITRTIHDCLELFQNKVRQKGITLKLTLHKDVPRILYTDHQRMSQVLTNLLSNAVQFTLKGEVEVIVSKLANNNVLMTVTDTGIGMDETVIKKLERKLSNEMLKEKLSEASVGIGLGLYIANKLAKVLNPQKEAGIEFVSEAQIGSRFFFEIENKEPKRLDPMKSDIFHRGGSDFLGIDEKCDLMHRLKNYNSHSMKNLFRLSKKAISEGSQARVLIVDDEIFNITVIENFCKSLGVATEKAFNGKEAINKLKLCANDNQVPIKLVFMDVNMPVMDGYEATISIMNLIEAGEIDDTMVVGLTAYVSRDMIDKCYECGMAEVVNKPISKETLIEVLTRYKVLRSERNSVGRDSIL
jgi:CheY-like chemotaxis protein/anti-sigma regulatory factor (Ser/Thr protein kinase)